MDDILIRLRKWASIEAGERVPFELAADPNGWGPALTGVLQDAIAEIERLRGLAGAVSAGADFTTIRRNAKSF